MNREAKYNKKNLVVHSHPKRIHFTLQLYVCLWLEANNEYTDDEETKGTLTKAFHELCITLNLKDKVSVKEEGIVKPKISIHMGHAKGQVHACKFIFISCYFVA